jgi:hypothetical protein
MWSLGGVVALGLLGAAVSFGPPYLPQPDSELSRGLADARRLPVPTVDISGVVIDGESWDSELPYLRLVVRRGPGRVSNLILNRYSTLSFDGGPAVSPVGTGGISVPSLKGKTVRALVRPKLLWMAGDVTDVYVISASLN